MQHRPSYRNALLFALAFMAIMAILATFGPFHISMVAGTDPLSSLAQMMPSPVASLAPSQAALLAKAYIVEQKGVPAAALAIRDDRPIQFAGLGRQYQAITLMDTRPPGRPYKVLVDLQTGAVEEDTSAVFRAEAESLKAYYGNLEPELYQRLQFLDDDDRVRVAIWVAPRPGESLAELQAAAFTTLADRYPEARAAMQRFGKPMDIADRGLSQRIFAEYKSLMVPPIEARIRPLMTELQTGGFIIIPQPALPAFGAILPKSVILELSRRPDISRIFLAGAMGWPELETAVPTNLAPAVWARGIQGSNILIAILEQANVALDNTFLHHCIFDPACNRPPRPGGLALPFRSMRPGWPVMQRVSMISGGEWRRRPGSGALGTLVMIWMR